MCYGSGLDPTLKSCITASPKMLYPAGLMEYPLFKNQLDIAAAMAAGDVLRSRHCNRCNSGLSLRVLARRAAGPDSESPYDFGALCKRHN